MALYASSDLSPKVWVQIADLEMQQAKAWSLDFDVLQLGDPFSIELDNADGRNVGLFAEGDSITVHVEDPQVSTGKTLLYTGIVTGLDYASTTGGSTLTISGADLGWHLSNSSVPFWRGVQGLSWLKLYDLLISPSWGLRGLWPNNDLNRSIRQGRAEKVRATAAEKSRQAQIYALEAQAILQGRLSSEREWSGVAPEAMPPIQTQVGDTAADHFIRFAKFQKCLVNVSADGYLQVWKPQYDQRSQYTFALYRSTDESRNEGNIKDARLSTRIDGLYTDVRCFSSTVDPTIAAIRGPADWHAGEIKGRYVPTVSPLPFSRPHYFSDSEQYTPAMTRTRAQWKYQRGEFDSWTYTITVPGVSQGGIFYANDTICTVEDTVHNVKGLFYVSAVRMNRNLQGGTSTTLTIKKKGLLAA